MSAGDYLAERTESLLKRLEWVSENAGDLEGVDIMSGKLHIDRLEKDTPEGARDFSLSLYDLLPRVKLTELLIEVANWTKFHEQFIHASANRPPDAEETKVLMAAIMAMGTNVGLAKMAEATPDISYRQMANAAQWRLHEDAMSRAQSTLVNYHHKLTLSAYWGDGTTSSSDGMRVQIGVGALNADANPHYGTGKGATMYRFVSDQFSSFHVKVINTNVRDAVQVIDGLLHHETDLVTEEHYTDTAGYTDQVFGLTHLLGFRFAPRLRDISDSKLFFHRKAQLFPESGEAARRADQHKDYSSKLRRRAAACALYQGRNGFSFADYREARLLCPAKQFVCRAPRNGTHRENNLHSGLHIKRGAAAKDQSGLKQRRGDECIGQGDLFWQTRRTA